MARGRKQGELFTTDKQPYRIGEIERRCKRQELWPVIGTDEVGRGPLAGPVVAAAVMLRDGARLPGLADSKALTANAREALVPEIERQALAWAIVEADVSRIAAMNILGASMWAMRQAVEQTWAKLEGLSDDQRGPMPMVVLVDGNRKIPDLVRPGQRTITKGDQRSRAIAAASVLAKVHRDGLMVELDAVHPGYGLAQHKGYPTPAHIEALHELGPSSIHRAAFAPVAAVIAARKER